MELLLTSTQIFAQTPVEIVNDVIRPLSAIAAATIPYLLATVIMYKLMSSAGLGFIGDGLQKGQKAIGGILKSPGQRLEEMRRGEFTKGRNRLSRGVQRAAQYASHAPAAGITGIIRPGEGLGRIRDSMHSSRLDALEDVKNKKSFRNIEKNDTLLTAGLAGDAAARNGGDDRAAVRASLEAANAANPSLGLTGAALEQATASVMRARHDLGRNFGAAAVAAKAATGSGYGEVDAAGNPIGGALMLQDILSASDGDRNMEGHLLAATKGAAAGARRPDLNSSFGTGLQGLEDLRNGADAGTVSANMADNVIDQQGAAAVIGGRAESARSLAPALQRRLNNAWDALGDTSAAHAAAVAGGNPADIADAEEAMGAAQRRFEQDFASTEALIDFAQQASPDVGRYLADQVHSMPFDLSALPGNQRDWASARPDGTRLTGTTPITAREMFDHLGTRGPYNEMRRNFSNRYAAELAAGAGTT